MKTRVNKIHPHIGGGNPVVSSMKRIYFNDILGTTIGAKKGSEYYPAAITAFGETLETGDTHFQAHTGNSCPFFTGKPQVEGLGYTFLFRNYRASLGKWQTADPLGYPDGWNQLAYCGNMVQQGVDVCGGDAVVVGSFYDALNHYAYGNGVAAVISQNIMLQVLSTSSYLNDVLGGIVSALVAVSYDKSSGTFTLGGTILWEQGAVLGRTATNWNVTISWTASPWQRAEGGNFEWRNVIGSGIVNLSTSDVWDFEAHKNDPWWRTVFDEYMAGSCADLFSLLSTGHRGAAYNLSGTAHLDVTKNAYQYRLVE